MRRLLSITNRRLLHQFRDERQEYLRRVRLYNKVPGNVPMQPVPIIDLVSERMWRSVSHWELLPEHRTEPGEDPNDEEVTNWILGLGRYRTRVNRVRGTQVGMIKGVRWPEVKGERTHLDRFYEYADSMEKVLRKIPYDQMTSYVEKERVKALVGGLKPPVLKRMVQQAIEAAQDERAAGESLYVST